MRYRPLSVEDLPVVMKLYADMLAEAQRTATLKYPQPTPETPAEMMEYLYEELTAPARHACPHCRGDLGPRGSTFVSMAAVLGGFIGPDGAVRGGKPVGFAFAELTTRPVGVPKHVGHCRLIYVDPAQRKRRRKAGRPSVSAQLIQYLVLEGLRHYPDVVAECSWVPGSLGEKLWLRLGMRAYVTYGALVDEAGQPIPTRMLATRAESVPGGDTAPPHGEYSRRPRGAEQQAAPTQLGARRRRLAL